MKNSTKDQNKIKTITKTTINKFSQANIVHKQSQLQLIFKNRRKIEPLHIQQQQQQQQQQKQQQQPLTKVRFSIPELQLAENKNYLGSKIVHKVASSILFFSSPPPT